MFILLGLLLVMLSISDAQKPCSKDGKPCTWRHFKRVSKGNQAVPPCKQISSHNVHLLVECHDLCKNESTCYGFNFRVRPSSKYIVNCQLSNSTVKMNMTKMKNGPWNYWEDVLVTEEVDECAKKTHRCSSKANCTNTPGSYNCQCQVGYKGDGHNCSDINECTEGSHSCSINANCINAEGSVSCQCQIGYIGNGHTCRVHTLDSNILRAELKFQQKLGEWLPKTGNWKICWRATQHGWDSTTFHNKCDGKIPTLTIVKVVKDNKNLIFGGFSTVTWAGNNGYTSAPGSFMFSLRNNDDLPPFKSQVKDEKTGYAIWRSDSYGPTFGDCDLHIFNNVGANRNSHTYFGNTYQLPLG